MSEAFILRGGGGVSNKVPEFTYSGSYQFIDDGDNNWRIKFLTSGTLRFINLNSAKAGIDVFCVGGGGGGGKYGGGGGGGYTITKAVYGLEKNTDYSIVVGAGGAAATVTTQNGKQGGTTSAFGVKAAGGYSGYSEGVSSNAMYGGDGGSGGSGRAGSGKAGSDGYNGAGGYGIGKGQRNKAGPNGETGSTREFGESNGDLYAGGGAGWGNANGGGGAGGGGNESQSGAVNTGGGCGSTGGAHTGGSGIVVIRNRRA